MSTNTPCESCGTSGKGVRNYTVTRDGGMWTMDLCGKCAEPLETLLAEASKRREEERNEYEGFEGLERRLVTMEDIEAMKEPRA